MSKNPANIPETTKMYKIMRKFHLMKFVNVNYLSLFLPTHFMEKHYHGGQKGFELRLFL